MAQKIAIGPPAENNCRARELRKDVRERYRRDPHQREQEGEAKRRREVMKSTGLGRTPAYSAPDPDADPLSFSASGRRNAVTAGLASSSSTASGDGRMAAGGRTVIPASLGLSAAARSPVCEPPCVLASSLRFCITLAAAQPKLDPTISHAGTGNATARSDSRPPMHSVWEDRRSRQRPFVARKSLERPCFVPP